MQLTVKVPDGIRYEPVKPVDLKNKSAAEHYNVFCTREGKSKKVYNSPVLRIYGRIHAASPTRC
jgi:hypothetical protein